MTEQALQTPGIGEKINEDAPVPRKWGEGFRGGAAGINRNGRPKTKVGKDGEKKSNKQLRLEAMMQFARLLRPHLAKAVGAAAKILGNEEASDQNKLKAAAFVATEYRSLIKDIYDLRYDEDDGEELQQKPGTVFSLKIIDGEENKE